MTGLDRRRWLGSVLGAGVATGLGHLDATADDGSRVVPMIADPNFCHGFLVRKKPPKGKAKAKVIASRDTTERPKWRIDQHHSRGSLFDTRPEPRDDDVIVHANAYAHVGIRPGGVDDAAGGAGGDALIFGINGKQEYDNRYKSGGEPWPHLFIRQFIAAPRGHLVDTAPRLDALKALNFRIDARLIRDIHERGRAYTPKRHAAQCIAYLTVLNVNADSPGHGDYFWFGVRLYDDRPHRFKGWRTHVDRGTEKKTGTGKYIVSIGQEGLTPRVGVRKGERTHLEGDLLPDIRRGFQEAIISDCMTQSTDPADLSIGMLILGWEVSSLNNVAVALSGIGLDAVV